MNKAPFALLLWLVVWPAVTVLSWFLRLLVPEIPLPLHTLGISALLVPTMVWIAVPGITQFLVQRQRAAH